MVSNNPVDSYPYFGKHVIDYLMASVDEDDSLVINPQLFGRAAKEYIPSAQCRYDLEVESRISVDPMLRSSLITHLSIDHFLNLPYLSAEHAR